MKKKISKKRKQLLMNLEPLIGGCYNPHSTTVTAKEWGRYYETEEGREFDYPVTYIGRDGQKTRSPSLGRDIDQDVLMSGYYAFGANRLPVLRNLDSVLEYLERHHGLVIDDEENTEKPLQEELPNSNQPESTTLGKIRIFDLARELKIETKQVLNIARELGVEVSVPANTLPPSVSEKIRQMFRPKSP